MGRARQERGQQQWPGALGGHPQEQRELGPQPGPEEQPEQPLSQVPTRACRVWARARAGRMWNTCADFLSLIHPVPLSDSYSHLSGRPVRKKTEEEEKLLKLLQGIPRPQDGFTQWCEQMLHTLSTTGSLDGIGSRPWEAGPGRAASSGP